MEDKGIHFSWNGVPCSCQCDHCLLASGAQPCRVPYEDARKVVEDWLAWRNATNRTAMGVEFAAGYCADFPQLLDYVAFRIENRMQGADSLQVGGLRKRSRAELRSFLDSLRQAGIRRLGVSFHGMNRSHDRCTHRSGDFGFLMELVRTAAECALKRFETIFLRRSTLVEVPKLLVELDAIPGLENRCIGPFDYRGRGKLLESERPTLADLDSLPESAFQYIDRKSLRPESAWIQSIASTERPRKTRRYYMMPISDKTISYLKAERPESVFEALAKEDDAFGCRVPPLCELANSYGDRNGERVYALRDLEWKWTDMFLAGHPNIDRTGVFDDLKPCAICK